ncbi:hypothetical protein [Synechococcus sp. A15-127]|uniref:hypothetical protein n=1 Tax=Synechococcus sp. A15-127 TaxID=1050624 RepID=UPI00164844FB|nr:hypothetical protein [Synechococcus sp. A15-127]
MDSNSAVQIGTWRRAIKGMRSNGSSKYHYNWNFDDGNSGFIVHGKKRGKWLRRKYKMFIDSNGNGILDDSDELISKGKFEKRFRKQRPGRLIEKDTDGIITAKTYEVHDHSDHGHTEHDHGELFSHMGESGINALGIEHMSFMNLDNNMVLHDHGLAHDHDHSMTM